MNILILEDNEADAELVKRELRKADLDFLACWAQDKATFLAALETSAPDLILVDYALPGFDGLTALTSARQRWADVPVIIVSGAIGEEMAIDTLKAGATDYVLKQRLSRLGPAVRRAMAEASERARYRQAQEALRASEERYRRFFDEDLAGDFLATPDGRIVESNPAFAEIYGFADPQAATEHTIAAFNPEDWADLVARARKRRQIHNHQGTHRRPDGKQIHVVANVVGRFTEAGELAAVVGYVFDDTERKQAEDRLQADLAALMLVHELSTRLLEVKGLGPLWQETVDAAVAIMGAERGTLQLLEGDSLRMVAHHGHQRAFLELFVSAANRATPWGEAIRRGQRVIVADVERSPLFADMPSRAVLRNAGVRAVQSTPLLDRQGRPLGILTTHWSAPHVPDEHALWRIDLLARQAADLIEHKRAEEALRSANEDLRVQAEQLQTLNDMLQARQE